MYCPNPECPDFKDTGIPGEYVAGVTVCPFCDSRLVEKMPDTKARAKQDEAEQEEKETKQEEEPFSTIDELDEELVAITTYNLRQDAELAITYLINQGIDVFESPDDGGGTIPAAGGIRLLVPKSQAEQAAALLNDVEKMSEQADDSSGTDSDSDS
jgi:uncharacterized Zn finger protein (UPF0148 family)